MIKLCIGGVKITAEFSFFVFMAMMFLCGENSLITDYLICVLIHECAHGIALCAFGGSLGEILFTACGIRLIPARERILSYCKEIFVLSAGPLSNLLLFFMLHSAKTHSSFALVNLGTAVFNLLPYSLLDGGCILIVISQLFNCEKLMRYYLTTAQIFLFALSLICTVTLGLAFLPLTIFTLSYGIYDMKQK